MDEEEIRIPLICLKWSDWVPWNDLSLDARYEGGIRVPNGVPGVYEVRRADSEERLTIGKASNLRFRIKQGLIKGKTAHSTGENIRAHEDVHRLLVRWAQTDRPAAAEEDLHLKHRAKYGRLPNYTKHT